MSDEQLRVLIVEPSEEIRKLERLLVRHTFSPRGVEIVESAVAASALEQFKTEVFHLLLVDVSAQQSAEAVQSLVHTSRTRHRCPTIAFSTGKIDQSTLESLARDHCYAIFAKPFEPVEVQATIREAFDAQAHSAESVISPVLHGIMKLIHPIRDSDKR